MDEHRIKRFTEMRERAQANLNRIDEGWTFHEAHGSEAMRDVTEQRRAELQQDVDLYDNLIAAIKRGSL